MQRNKQPLAPTPKCNPIIHLSAPLIGGLTWGKWQSLVSGQSGGDDEPIMWNDCLCYSVIYWSPCQHPQSLNKMRHTFFRTVSSPLPLLCRHILKPHQRRQRPRIPSLGPRWKPLLFLFRHILKPTQTHPIAEQNASYLLQDRSTPFAFVISSYIVDLVNNPNRWPRCVIPSLPCYYVIHWCPCQHSQSLNKMRKQF